MRSRPTSTYVYRSLALGCVLLAFGLRLWRLDTQSLWHDEGLSWWFARQSLRHMVQDVASTEHPPLYFVLLGLWMRLAGESPFALRWASVFPGVLTVAGLYALGARWRLRTAALLAALLLALHPMHIWYSQELRPYAWMAAWNVALTGWAWLWYTRGRWRDGLLYGLLAAGGLYIHVFLAFPLLVQAFVLFVPRWFQATTRRERWRLAAPYALVALLFLPWFLPLVDQLRTNRTYWYWGFLDVPVVLRQTALAFAFFGFPDNMPVSLWRQVAYVAWGLVGVGTLYLWSRPYGRLLAGSVWGVLGLTLTLAYLAPKYAPRYVLDVLPFWLLLVTAPLAAAGQALTARRREAVPLVLALGVLLVGAYGILAHRARLLTEQPPVARPNFRDPTTFVAKAAAAGDAVVLVGGHMEPVVRYYLRRPDVALYPMPRRLLVDLDRLLTWWDVAPQMERITRTHARVWLLRWQEDLADPQHLAASFLYLYTCPLPTPPLSADVRLNLFYVPAPIDLPAEPVPSRAVGIPFRNGLELVGYDAARVPDPAAGLDACRQARDSGDRLVVAPGETLFVVLYLRPTLRLTRGLTGFVHLVTADGSKALGIMDRLLGGYTYPPIRWRVGEIVLQEFPVPVPPDTPPGEYALEVGLYYPETVQRIDPLPAQVPGARTDGSRILMGPVYVERP